MKKNNPISIIHFLTLAAIMTVTTAGYAQKSDKEKESKSGKEEISCPMMDKMADKNKLPEDCPMMKKKESETSGMKMGNKSDDSDHLAMVMSNGEKEMGFSQTKTTHHFLIMKDGGAIQVEANDIKDTDNRDKIRKHLTEITKQFQNGIFTTPFAVHGTMPPGVPEMDQLKNEIQYSYEETEKGARVRILTNNPKALAAIHAFLKFQIEEHQTGDPSSLKD